MQYKSSISYYNESPCDLLTSKPLNHEATYVSTTFVPTLRLKEWKPIYQKQASESNYKYDYCYIDQTDPALPPDRCDAQLFGNAPFINSTFIDSNQDITRALASKKCVLQIDPTQVTSESLDTFWGTMSNTECMTMVNTFQASNLTLESEITDYSQRITDMSNIIADYQYQSNRNAKQIASLMNKISTTIYENESLSTYIKDNQQLFNNRASEYTTMNASCIRNISELKTSFNGCTTELTYWVNNSNNTSYLYSTSNPIYEKQQVQYGLNLMAFSNIRDQYNAKKAAQILLQEQYKTLSNDNTQCFYSLNSCTSQLQTCTTKDNTAITNAKQYLTQWTACTAQLDTCSNNTHACDTSVNTFLKPENKSSIVTFQACEASLRDCQTKLEQDRATAKTIKYNTDEWIRTHMNCTPYQPPIDTLNAEIQQILTWCTFAQEASLQWTQDLNTMYTSEIQDLSSQAKSCTSNLKAMSNTLQNDKITDLTVFYHYAFNFNWTNAKNGGSAAFGEAISTISTEDAKTKLEKIVSPRKPPWNGVWKNFNWGDVLLKNGNKYTSPYSWTSAKKEYEQEVSYGYGTNSTWVVQIGGPVEITATPEVM